MSKAFKCDRCKNMYEGGSNQVLIHIADGDKRFASLEWKDMQPGFFMDGYYCLIELCNACTGAYDNALDDFLKFLPK